MSNEKKVYNLQYKNIVSDILDNDEFNKMEEIIHHGLDRKNHSIRVSYYSYKIGKLLRLDYSSCARAGLLHDFFFETNDKASFKTRMKTLVNHPKYALENANKEFDLNEKEKDIIASHMFPITVNPPKYLEGWIVNLVDDCVAVAEIGYSARAKLSYVLNFMLILMFTYFK